MKTKRLSTILAIAIVLNCQITRAKEKRDIFFRGDSKDFIKIDRIRLGGRIYVLYSGCRDISNMNAAICTKIARVEEREILGMEACMLATGNMIKIGVAVGATAITVASGGGMAVGLLATAGTGVVLTSNVARIVYPRLSDVYNSNVRNNIDHYVGSETSHNSSGVDGYEDFIDALRDSTESSFFACDTNDGAELLSEGTTLIPMTDQQQKMLRGT